MKPSLIVMMIAGAALVAPLMGCSNDGATANGGGVAPANAGGAKMAPEQRQQILESGRAHQTGGMARARAMQQGTKP